MGIGDIHKAGGGNHISFLAKDGDGAVAGIEEHTEAIIADDKDAELMLIQRVSNETIFTLFHNFADIGGYTLRVLSQRLWQ